MSWGERHGTHPLTCLLEPPWAEIWMSTLASGKSKELSPTYRERTDVGCDLVEAYGYTILEPAIVLGTILTLFCVL